LPFDAAERHLRLVVHRRAIDMADPIPMAAPQRLRTRDGRARRPQPTAVLVVIGAAIASFDVVHADDALDRAEGLLAVMRNRGGHVFEQRAGIQRASSLAAA